MKILNKIRAVYNRENLSPPVRLLLEQEEIQGARVANRFRYLFSLLLAVSVYVNSRNLDTHIGWYINGIALGCYVLVTLAHTLVLHRTNHFALVLFSYASILFDYAILFAALIAWFQVAAPDEYAFVVKNPFHFYLFLPITTTLFQFRLRLVGFAFALYMLLYFGMIGYGLGFAEMTFTPDWRTYVLGDTVVLEDMLSTKPLLFLILALSVGYTIYRAMLLTRRVGEIEAQKQNLSRYFSPEVAREIAATKKMPRVKVKGKSEPLVLYAVTGPTE